jgi:hypothetical protein
MVKLYLHTPPTHIFVVWNLLIKNGDNFVFYKDYMAKRSLTPYSVITSVGKTFQTWACLSNE